MCFLIFKCFFMEFFSIVKSSYREIGTENEQHIDLYLASWIRTLGAGHYLSPGGRI